MPSVEGLAALSQLQQQQLGQQRGNQQYNAMQQAVPQAIGKFQQGDYAGAYGIMAQANPQWAYANADKIDQIVPGFAQQMAQSKTAGGLNAAEPTESTPGQVAHISADGRIAAAEARAQSADNQLKSFINNKGDNSFISVRDLKNGNNGNVITPQGQDQMEVDSQGNQVALGKGQIKTLNSEKDKFNAMVKPDIDAINSTVSSEDITKANVPGSKVAEKVNTLRALYKSGRVPEALIKQYMGTDAGLITNAQDKFTEAEGDGLGPNIRQNIFQFNQALQHSLLTQYEAKLVNSSKQVGDINKIDPAIVKKYFAGAGPTPVQQIQQKVSQLDPQTQAVFNKAHDDLFNPDPAVQQRAQKVMQVMQQKYGISF